MARSANRVACLIFVGVAALLLALHGQRMLLTNDEGIVLESAQRMASGGRIYVDFFGYMSPGSYWLQAALFRVFGVSLWVARIPVIFGLSLQCALLFWLTARFTSRRAALATLLVFFGFQIADPSFLTAQHRWDSATLSLAGLCLAVAFATRPFHWAFAGEVVGGNANDLTSLVADPNVSMHEAKAFTCQIHAGRGDVRAPTPTKEAAPWPTREPVPDTPPAAQPEGRLGRGK